MPAQLTATVVKPLRLNFAQVCVWCGTRWCESPRCIELFAQSVWMVCPDCDGAMSQEDNSPCHCYGGVIEAPSPAFRVAFAGAVAEQLAAGR